MVSREHMIAAVLHEKMQLLRSVTKSSAHPSQLNQTSIILDASTYIEELKQKVERLNEEITYANERQLDDRSKYFQVTVETLEKGFLINVFSERSWPGLLASILEVFNELGLNVLDARASCTDNFRLEAVVEENQLDSVGAHLIKQEVLRAVKNCTESSEDQRNIAE